MSLATALKGAVADARPLQNPDFRRLWVTQIITMIGAQLTAARLEGHGEQGGEVNESTARSLTAPDS
jgi:hypothetical protein